MKIKKTRVERMTITGPMEEQTRAIRFCRVRGFTVLRSGAQVRRGRANVDRYKVVAETSAQEPLT